MPLKRKKINKLNLRSNKRDYFYFFVWCLILFFVFFLFFSNYRISHRRKVFLSRIDIMQKELVLLEQKNKDLMKGFAQAGTEEHLEKIAREQLNLKAKGEEVIVITREKEKEEEEIKDKNVWNPKYWWEWLKGN